MSDHVAIIVKNGKDLLFAKRSQTKRILPGAWAFPSGTRQAHESLSQTALREAMEELGIVVQPESVLCTQELPEFNDTLHFIPCTILSGEPSIREPNEIDQLLWMPLPEFLERHDDSEIGHGLIFLRSKPDLCSSLT